MEELCGDSRHLNDLHHGGTGDVFERHCDKVTDGLKRSWRSVNMCAVLAAVHFEVSVNPPIDSSGGVMDQLQPVP